MSHSFFATQRQTTQEALKYAEACLKQGMGYANAARASGVPEDTLRRQLPGHRPGHRETPEAAIQPPKVFTACAALLPDATPAELKNIAALALAMLADIEGRGVAISAANGIICALPSPPGLPAVHRVSGSEIARCVASYFGISWEEFISERRTYRVCRPRMIAMVALRQFAPHLSFPAIGRLLGGRDHTTVLSGVARIEKVCAKSPEFANEVRKALEAVQERFGDRLLMAEA